MLGLLPTIYSDVLSIMYNIIYTMMWSTDNAMCAMILKDPCLSHIQKVMAQEM